MQIAKLIIITEIKQDKRQWAPLKLAHTSRGDV